MPTTPRSRRSTLLRSALTLSAVAGLTALTACGSGGSGGSGGSSIASGTPTPSATGTSGASPSAVTSAGGSSTVGTRGATATAKATGKGGAPATPSGVLWQPWTNASYKVGFFEPPADGGGSVHPIIVTFGQYIPEGETWTVAKTNQGSRYEVLATGRFYLSCLLTGKKAPTPGSDFCPVTLEQLDSYVIAHRTNTPEFWYTLDAMGRINLAYQLYRP